MKTHSILFAAMIICSIAGISAFSPIDKLQEDAVADVLINRSKSDQYITLTASMAMSMKVYKTTGNTKILWVFEETSDGFYRIKNVSNGKYLNCEKGSLMVTDIEPEWQSAMWSLEPVDGYVRIKNKWKNQYLHNQNGSLELGEVSAASQNAHWKKRAP